MTDADRIQQIREQFPQEGFFQDKEWELSPRAFPLDLKRTQLIRELGPALRHFQQVCNEIYLDSADGLACSWIAECLDRGKPKEIVLAGRAVKRRNQLPRVIRPDLVLTDDGVAIVELDSVPGGIGLTAWLNLVYSSLGDDVVGGPGGMIEGFRQVFPSEDVVISEESSDYVPEMRWLMDRLGQGRKVIRDWEIDAESLRSRAVYRFFELFDLPNVKHGRHWIKLEEEGQMELTPPIKAFLEEKLWLALFWSPDLADEWERRLSAENLALLKKCIPRGWIMDPRPLPAFAELSGLGVHSWAEVMEFGRREREMVVKISGFSELGWGSRGVAVGHDLSQREWKQALENALASFASQPYLMQRFHHAAVVEHPVWTESIRMTRLVKAKVRLCPYYFGMDDAAYPALGGVLATVCPADKKLLHGMRDAMMLPCVCNDA